MILVANNTIRFQEKIPPAMNQDTPFLPGLSPVDGLDIQARFDGGALSSDGGVMILREIERKLKFAHRLAQSIHDKRDPLRTRHTYTMMIRARMLAIACGYEGMATKNIDTLRCVIASR